MGFACWWKIAQSTISEQPCDWGGGTRFHLVRSQLRHIPNIWSIRWDLVSPLDAKAMRVFYSRCVTALCTGSGLSADERAHRLYILYRVRGVLCPECLWLRKISFRQRSRLREFEAWFLLAQSENAQFKDSHCYVGGSTYSIFLSI